jgi:hypothetical protein
MSATVTPAPVEYCQAWVTSSMALPGGGCPTSGSPMTTGAAHSEFCFISSSGPGGPSGGSAPGLIAGRSMAWAVGAAHTCRASSAAAAPTAAVPRTPRVGISDT